ncbi:calcium-binding protein [Ensifer soli]|uniref:calcium-binding protein n=1 Tax=Ciceribacter sp. sgz301302 TaxID=3342379 RepID=UPI0035B7BDDB
METGIVSFTESRALRENLPADTILGAFSLSGVSEDDVVYTIEEQYKILYGEGFVFDAEVAVDYFSISQGRLVTTAPLDYETQGYNYDNTLSSVVPIRVNVTATARDGTVLGSEQFTFHLEDTVETVWGSGTNNTLKGSVGADKIIGLGGRDTLFGFGGDDILYGGAGADVLSGDEGGDFYDGFPGNDRFLYKTISESTVAAADRITDFSRGDVIDLKAIDADTTAAGNQAFSWRGARGFSGEAGELRYAMRATETVLYADVDGDRRADMAIRFEDAFRLYKIDFVF